MEKKNTILWLFLSERRMQNKKFKNMLDEQFIISWSYRNLTILRLLKDLKVSLRALKIFFKRKTNIRYPIKNIN